MMKYVDELYQSLCGNMVRPVPGISSLYYPGSDCDRAWERITQAYEHLCERLGVEDEDEDEDVEDIISAFLCIQYEFAVKMFEYRREYEKAL